MAHEPHDQITTVAVSPSFAQDQTLLAATGGFTLKLGTFALLKSTDGGVNWSGVEGLPNNTEMVAIAFSPAYSQDQTIFIAGAGGLFQTTNQGASWNLSVTSPLQSVALSPNFATDGTLFVVTIGRTILKSTSRGQSWTPLPAPASLTSGLTVISVSSNYAIEKILLLGSNADGIFESANGGASWVHVTSGLTVPSVTALAFSPGFNSDRTVFAGTLGMGVLVSTSGGSSWTTSNSGITDLNASSLALSPTYMQDSTLWIATAASGVFRSNTRGTSWAPGTTISRALSPQTNIHYRAVAAASSGNGAVLYLGMWEGLWTSNNGASSWQYIDTIPTRLIRYINLSPNYTQDQTVFASTYGSGNLWSINSGSTWTFQNTGMQWPYTDASGFSPSYAADGIAFSGNSPGLQKTSDRGASWQLLQGGLGVHTYVRALAISPNFAQDSTLFIGTRAGTAPPCLSGHPTGETGLFLSKDAGNTWLQTSLTRPTSAVCWGIIGAAMSPAFASDQTGFAASPDTGLYKSTDGGNNWTQLATPSARMATVVISPNFAQDQTVFATGYTMGIFKSTDGGSTWSTLSQTNTLKALDIRISPNYANDQTVFVATIQQGLVEFTNGGLNMVQLTSFPDHFVTAVGLSPNFANDHTLFAAGYHGLYKSMDGGNTWTYTVEPARIEESRNITGAGQQSPTITYQGRWSLAPSPVASTSAYMITSESGDTATLSFTGSGVRWVSRTGPKQGSASIQLDGVSEGTVSLKAPTNKYQQNVWEQHGITCSSHTFTITALPQSGQTISLDAFDVWVDTCPQ